VEIFHDEFPLKNGCFFVDGAKATLFEGARL